MQDCGGGTETAFVGMLITSAVAMFFSCSGATGFSEIRFDSESSVLFETRTGFSIGRMKLAKVMFRLLS
jgi:hypothetical protein